MYQDFKFFNPLHIIEFQGESRICATSEPEEFIHQWLQKVDFGDAIQYAEEQLIPSLQKAKRDKFQHISPQYLNIHLNLIHVFTASTLAAEKNIKAGQYAPATVLRWEKSSRFYYELREALAQNIHCDLQAIFKKYDLEEIGPQFIAILEAVEKDPTIEEIESKRSFYIDHDQYDTSNPMHVISHQFNLCLRKCIDAHHAGKLLPAQQQILDKIFKIATKPEDIPQKMNEFFTILIDKLKSSQNTTEAAAELAWFSYLNLTEIHGYFNANGRTAAIFMNSLLVALGFPTIILRTQQDKADPNSLYNQAIRHIDSNPELLKAHILNRLNESLQAKNAYRTVSQSVERILWRQNLAAIYIAKELNQITDRLQLQRVWPQCKEMLELEIVSIEKEEKEVAQPITLQYQNYASRQVSIKKQDAKKMQKLSKNTSLIRKK